MRRKDLRDRRRARARIERKQNAEQDLEQIIVYDLQGKKIAEMKANTPTDTGNWPHGVYVMCLRLGTTSRYVKLLK